MPCTACGGGSRGPNATVLGTKRSKMFHPHSRKAQVFPFLHAGRIHYVTVAQYRWLQAARQRGLI